MIAQAGYVRLQDVSGKDLGRGPCGSMLSPGAVISVAGHDVEVDTDIARDEYLKGMPGRQTGPAAAGAETPAIATDTRKPKSKSKPKPKPAQTQARTQAQAEPGFGPPKPLHAVAPRSAASKMHFKTPLLASSVLPKQDGPEPTPRHDPKQPGALVMRRPKSAPLKGGKRLVDVVVDPVLCQHLRPHQREGVAFLYDCVMGERSWVGQGAILADEMGLGKTLQAIALLWTLLKQNPVYGDAPVIQKAMIVCPATLVANWRREFMKWLGRERIGVLVADGTKRLTDFTHGKAYSVLVIGYERLRNVQDELQRGAGVDIVILDEGHRLKTAQNKSAQVIKALDTPRRVILSGTPIQNDLSEFFAMVEIVNPGMLGTYNAFRKEFEVPIVRSRQPGASAADVETGAAKSEELAKLTNLFILRRTAEHISKHLPAKTEYVLFCKPTRLQRDTYRTILSSPSFSGIFNNSEASLQLITVLRKTCNDPTLLRDAAAAVAAADEEGSAPVGIRNILSDLSASLPSLAASTTSSSSAKMQVLGRLLHALRTATKEKVVLVSNFTATLDLLQRHLTAHDMPFLRLDGSTPAAKRQDLVDAFNRTPASACFAFLLSARAGGTGLNLVGASRLVLFEADWNPSTDLQAMARVHRDGQKRAVRIYRLLTAGAIDEKIWQRQLTKIGLADSIIDQATGGSSSSSSFSAEELRDLFTLDTTSSCQTHDLVECPCDGLGGGDADCIGKSPYFSDDDGTATVAAANGDEEDNDKGNSDDDDDDDDDGLPELGAFIKASAVDMELQEWRIREGKKGANKTTKKARASKLQALKRYRHVDVAKFAPLSTAEEEREDADSGEEEGAGGANRGRGSSRREQRERMLQDVIEDDVLLDVLEAPDSRVTYVFSTCSSSSSSPSSFSPPS